jgi:glucose-1-phosphate thymidylyltransferase
VNQPEAYGVVKLNDANEIVGIGRKNRKTSSIDLAVIKIYYFKEGDLKQELQNVLDNNIKMVEVPN